MHEPSAFRHVPRTGVIYVTTEAQRRGFSPTNPEWCNLGQGMPETGELPGAPPRVKRVEVLVDDQEYAPVPGLWELRETVASLYNTLYRRGLPRSTRPRTSPFPGAAAPPSRARRRASVM
jgi:hypothetical protein